MRAPIRLVTLSVAHASAARAGQTNTLSDEVTVFFRHESWKRRSQLNHRSKPNMAPNRTQRPKQAMASLKSGTTELRGSVFALLGGHVNSTERRHQRCGSASRKTCSGVGLVLADNSVHVSRETGT
jgi:hypothetical protein